MRAWDVENEQLHVIESSLRELEVLSYPEIPYLLWDRTHDTCLYPESYLSPSFSTLFFLSRPHSKLFIIFHSILFVLGSYQRLAPIPKSKLNKFLRQLPFTCFATHHNLFNLWRGFNFSARQNIQTFCVIMTFILVFKRVAFLMCNFWNHII